MLDSSIPTYADLVAARFSRRALLLGAAGAAAASALTLRLPGAAAATGGSTLTFPELTKIYDATHHVADGYNADILVRWGDAIIAGAKDLDAANQNAATDKSPAPPAAPRRTNPARFPQRPDWQKYPVQ